MFNKPGSYQAAKFNVPSHDVLLLRDMFWAATGILLNEHCWYIVLSLPASIAMEINDVWQCQCRGYLLAAKARVSVFESELLPQLR